jgi:hypothetical protein
MTKTAHTQGPWTVDFFDKPYILTDDHTTYVAEVVDEDEEGMAPPREQVTANARLIAAAPELLAVVEKLEKQFRQDIDNDEPISGADAVDFICELAPLARAAIAKAHGHGSPDRCNELARLQKTRRARTTPKPAR